MPSANEPNVPSIREITFCDRAALDSIKVIDATLARYGSSIEESVVLVLSSLIKRLEQDHGQTDLLKKVTEMSTRLSA